MKRIKKKVESDEEARIKTYFKQIQSSKADTRSKLKYSLKHKDEW